MGHAKPHILLIVIVPILQINILLCLYTHSPLRSVYEYGSVEHNLYINRGHKFTLKKARQNFFTYLNVSYPAGISLISFIIPHLSIFKPETLQQRHRVRLDFPFKLLVGNIIRPYILGRLSFSAPTRTAQLQNLNLPVTNHARNAPCNRTMKSVSQLKILSGNYV